MRHIENRRFIHGPFQGLPSFWVRIHPSVTVTDQRLGSVGCNPNISHLKVGYNYPFDPITNHLDPNITSRPTRDILTRLPFSGSECSRPTKLKRPIPSAPFVQTSCAHAPLSTGFPWSHEDNAQPGGGKVCVCVCVLCCAGLGRVGWVPNLKGGTWFLGRSTPPSLKLIG